MTEAMSYEQRVAALMLEKNRCLKLVDQVDADLAALTMEHMAETFHNARA